MPIRTHRGRAAVYRRLWGWPLRSPKHLIMALVLLVALVSVVGLLMPRFTPAGGATDSGQQTVDYTDDSGAGEAGSDLTGDSGDGGETVGAPPTISVPTVTAESAAPSPEGMDVVRAWVSNWARHSPDTTRKQWLDRLRPYTTPELIGVMESVDPANVPATELAGELRAETSTKGSMRVMAPTDGPTLRVHVVRLEQGWRVAGYDRVD